MATVRSVVSAIAAVACVVISLAVNLAHADPADSNDPRVRALATSLGNNPTTIFQYVRDNIGIEVYTGSLRGARGTLASKAGNALDRASLLIALLKAASPAIEARYVQGTLSSTDSTTLLCGCLPRRSVCWAATTLRHESMAASCLARSVSTTGLNTA